MPGGGDGVFHGRRKLIVVNDVIYTIVFKLTSKQAPTG
jgi:hypothetical protein